MSVAKVRFAEAKWSTYAAEAKREHGGEEGPNRGWRRAWTGQTTCRLRARKKKARSKKKRRRVELRGWRESAEEFERKTFGFMGSLPKI